MIEIVPSILSADFTRLGEQVRATLDAGVKRIHIDVMDGQFVPNLTMGPQIVQDLRPLADEYDALLEVHLMIMQPERFVEDFVWSGADVVIVHVETCPHLHRVVQQIRELHARPCVALNPATPLVMLHEILFDLNQVLIMTVDPGFGGQHLIPSTLPKIAQLQHMLAERHLDHIAIEVDGGVHTATIADVVEAGATLAVVGSGVFEPHNAIQHNLEELRAAATPTTIHGGVA
jgi:ribulose-phosphate 3-epimerase